MRLRVAFALLLALVAGAATPVSAAETPSPLVRVEILSETASIRPGETFWVALRQEITPGWHTYWGVNPGDAGEPTRIEWTLPAGVSAGEIAWPYPSRFPVGIAMSYGYENGVVLPIPMTVSDAAAPGTTVTLGGRVSWLVVAKVSFPGEAPAALSVPVTAGPPRPDPRGAPLIAAARRNLPVPSAWPASYVATPETVTLSVTARDLAPERVAEVWFYPSRWGAIAHAAPQRAPGARPRHTRGRARTAGGSGDAAPRRGAGRGRAARRRHRSPGVRAPGRAAAGVERARGPAGAGAGPGRRPRAEPDAVRAAGPVGEDARPRRPRGRTGRAAPARSRLHGWRARLVCRHRRRAARGAGGWTADRLGIPAPVADGRHPAGVRALRRRAQSLRRVHRERPLRRSGPRAGRTRGLHRVVLNRRARHGGGDAVHRAVHGRGRGLRGHAAVADRALALRGARPRPGAALPGPDARPGMAAIPAEPGSVDGAAEAGARVPALRVGSVAGLGREPADRLIRRGGGAGWTAPDRLRGVAASGFARRAPDVAPGGDARGRRARPGRRRAGPAPGGGVAAARRAGTPVGGA